MSAERIDRDEVILAAVVRGMTNAQVAEVADCSARTVVNVKDRNRDRLADLRKEHAERLADALANLSLDVLDRLRGIIANGNDRDAVAAARISLAEARGWRDAAWTVDQIEEIKDELAQRRQTR